MNNVALFFYAFGVFTTNASPIPEKQPLGFNKGP
jgi:hypothetical protein